MGLYIYICICVVACVCVVCLCVCGVSFVMYCILRRRRRRRWEDTKIRRFEDGWEDGWRVRNKKKIIYRISIIFIKKLQKLLGPFNFYSISGILKK